MRKIKVMSVFGTRPEAIKMAPLVKELERREEIESYVCLTGQHREMLDSVMEIFDLKADFDLNIMEKRQPLRFDLLEKTDIRLIAPQGKDGAVPTVRNADGPYHDGQLVLSVDGFLVSPNVEVTDSEVVSTGFAYSDHNPICMSVTLLAQ